MTKIVTDWVRFWREFYLDNVHNDQNDLSEMDAQYVESVQALGVNIEEDEQ